MQITNVFDEPDHRFGRSELIIQVMAGCEWVKQLFEITKSTWCNTKAGCEPDFDNFRYQLVRKLTEEDKEFGVQLVDFFDALACLVEEPSGVRVAA